MDTVILALLGVLILVIILGTLAWRPHRRRDTPEQALEDELLRREFDRTHTETIVNRDRFNLP